jgi:hypothetical protein
MSCGSAAAGALAQLRVLNGDTHEEALLLL